MTSTILASRSLACCSKVFLTSLGRWRSGEPSSNPPQGKWCEASCRSCWVTVALTASKISRRSRELAVNWAKPASSNTHCTVAPCPKKHRQEWLGTAFRNLWSRSLQTFRVQVFSDGESHGQSSRHSGTCWTGLRISGSISAAKYSSTVRRRAWTIGKLMACTAPERIQALIKKKWGASP